MVDLRQTSQYTKYIKLLNWKVEKVEDSFVFIRRISIIGSVVKLQRPEKLSERVIKRLSDLGKQYRAFQIVIEPKDSVHKLRLADYGYRISRSPSLATKTIHIDLTKSEDKLLSGMHYKTRYNIRLGKRLKVKVKSSKDINSFANFWQNCAFKQRRMFLPMKREIIAIYNSFGKNAYILFAYTQGGNFTPMSSRTNKVSEAISGISLSKKRLLRHSTPRNDTTIPLAAILLIRTKDIAYYMYAASTRKGKKLFAPTAVAWESIKLSKNLGCKMYDFEGIYDERFPLSSWKGFSRFKKSFGGKVVEYPGSFVKYKLPF